MMKLKQIGPATLLGVLALALAACSSEPGTRAVRTMELDELAIDGRLPAVKPEGVIVTRGKREEHESGPPPYGYIKVIGEPVPNWTWGGAQTRTGLSWTFIGPKPMASEYWSGEGNAGGHVAAIAPHPSDPNTVYLAANTGGVWKTTDAGANWTPLTDQLSILNHGAIAIDPSNPNVIYIGSGSTHSGSSGDGLFKSTDAGATWSRIGTTTDVGSQINRVVVHPQSPGTLHVTGSGGYYRTLNGGGTWTRIISAACSSVVIHPTSPNIVYIGRNSQGVYKSTTDGSSPTKLAGGLPTSGFTQVLVDISKSNPQVLYAAFLSGGGIQGLYRTSDGGTNWTKLTNAPNFPSPQGYWNAYVAVDPTNENKLFVGGVDSRYAEVGISRSLDAGAPWTEVGLGPPSVHPDHHCMAFGPTGVIWEGNDGGVWKSTNGGSSWTNCNATLAAAQIYNLVQHPSLTLRALGGTQDNGTPERSSSSTSWAQLQVGDGGYSVFDPSTTTNRRSTTYVYLDIPRWPNSSSKGTPGGWGSAPANFIAPLVGDPNSGSTLLGGTNRIWRTTNATATTPTWTAISTNAVGAGGTINAIAVATGASNTIYSGSSTGDVYVTTDATAWNNRSTGLPNGQISDIVIAPSAPGTAYVAYYNTTGNRVLKTTDYGVTWTPMSAGLPSGVSAGALAVDFAFTPPTLYVGAGAGMYYSSDNGATWTKNNATLPNVNVADLFIDPIARTITAGTYGRGAWMANLPQACPADFNGDGFVNGDDYDAFAEAFDNADPAGDFNNDGFVNGDDYDAFAGHFDAGC